MKTKRIVIFLLFVLLLTTAFFAYRYFPLQTQADRWDESLYQPYEALCEIEIPILVNETGDNNSKVNYLTWQSILFFPLPSEAIGGSRKGMYSHAVSFGFEKKCPTVFHYFLLYELYPDHVREPFFKHNQAFETQSTATESSPQHCELSLSLPNIYEDFAERLRQHLKLRLSSFESVTAVDPLDGHTVLAQLAFNSGCDQVLADYIMQDMMPADYFKQQSH
ncbi:hypothetical protein [Oligella urethralis]|uniref:hypothetical protein n=1 Tax=Oligella urethralis TaxID=90245 RepID=UPI002432B8E2|nr:hypothetical protein [Oligella urethralis]